MCKLQIYSPYRKKQGSGSSPLCTFLGTCRSVSDPEPVNTLLFFNVDPLVTDLYFSFLHQMTDCTLECVLTEAKLSLDDFR